MRIRPTTRRTPAYRWAQGLIFSLVALLMAATAPAHARYASIVIDAETGEILYEKNANTGNYPASLTKMMTLYLLFEALDSGRVEIGQAMPVSKRAAARPATTLGLRAGERITVEQAIHALIIRSANDVATVVAEALGGGEAKFAQLMTERARELGMANTTFRNASGLPDKNQKSTARDLALLARALWRAFPHHYHYFSAESFEFRGRTYATHNRILKNYAGADGLKTGYIRASGYNVATSAVRDGRRLIGVVLGGKSARSRDSHMASLLDSGFAALMTGAAPAADDAPVVAALPPQTAPAPVQVAEADPTPPPAASGRWAVQVGAFSRFKPAERAALKAARDFPALLGGAHIVVDQASNRKGSLYRARLVGLTKQDARAACRQLEARKTDCLVVKPNLALALTTAQ